MSERSSTDIAREAVSEREAMQKPRELAFLLDLLRARGVRRVLEIGGNHGGSAWAFRQIASSVVVVDRFVLDGRMEHAGLGVEVVQGDSRDPATRALAAERLGGLADFLFIDGDHSLEGVWADWDMYSPLVAAGGAVGIHDVSVPHENREAHDVIPFWNTVRSEYPHAVYYDPTVPEDPARAWGGIGVLFT